MARYAVHKPPGRTQIDRTDIIAQNKKKTPHMTVTSNTGLVLMCGVDHIRAGTTNQHPATCYWLMRDKTGDTVLFAVSCGHLLMQCTHFVTQ